jgi:hypothetical protein
LKSSQHSDKITSQQVTIPKREVFSGVRAVILGTLLNIREEEMGSKGAGEIRQGS